MNLLQVLNYTYKNKLSIYLLVHCYKFYNFFFYLFKYYIIKFYFNYSDYIVLISSRILLNY